MKLLIIRKHFERVSNLFLIVFLLLFLLFSSVGSASASWSIDPNIDNVIPSSAKISLSADANGKIHVSYIDDTSHSLKYANNVSGSWTTATVPGVSVSAAGISMAIDSLGKVHICSQGSLGELYYTTNSSGAWASTTIDTLVGLHDPGIAVDSNNRIHISYLDVNSPYYLKYATNVSGFWQTSIIVDGPGTGSTPYYASAIAVDKNSKAHICYYDSNSPYSFKYITNVSGVWQVTTIENIGPSFSGYQISIAVDQNIAVHTVYYNTTNDEVKYATNASGSWTTTRVSEVGVDAGVGHMSVAVDNGGRAHISYIGWIYGGTTIALKYVTNKQGTWQAQTVESDGTEYRSSIAISPDQRVHVGYYFSPDGNVHYDVKHAYYNDSAPTVTTGSATNVTPISATLNGTVNPNGLLTNYYFQWGTTTTYGHTTTSQSAGGGTGTVPVSANLTGLTPNTNYHYQLKATNSAGTNYGADMTFKTKSAMPWLMLLLGN